MNTPNPASPVASAQPDAAPTSPTQLWLIDPRDPVVLGDGRAALAYVTSGTWPFPFPGTMAGMVRTTLLQGRSQVSREDAHKLLTVQIRGPWLVEPKPKEGDPPTHNPSRLRVPAPTDVMLAEHDGINPSSHRLRGAELIRVEPDEGTLWPAHAPGSIEPEPSHLVQMEERVNGAKLEPLKDQFWPLSLAVLWGLGVRPDDSSPVFTELATKAVEAAADKTKKSRLLHHEQRVHVSLDDKTGTAAAGMLYSSGGLRLEEHWRLAVEVTTPLHAPLATREHLTLLGGESRPSYLCIKDLNVPNSTSKPAGAFPDFSAFEADFKMHAPQAAGLRIQLLTPAYLPARTKQADRYHEDGDPGWCPSWLLNRPDAKVDDEESFHPALRSLLRRQGLCLKLEALCMPGYQVVSGWNLQGRQKDKSSSDARLFQRTGSPREVRRLVPAGSVFYLSLAKGNQTLPDASAHSALLVDLCRALWGQVLDPNGHGEAANLLEDFRAPAARDGYGLILPGFWRRESPQK